MQATRHKLYIVTSNNDVVLTTFNKKDVAKFIGRDDIGDYFPRFANSYNVSTETILVDCDNKLNVQKN